MKNPWLNKAARVARQVNAARWLETVLPALTSGCFVVGCAVLVARRLGAGGPVFLVLAGLMGALFLLSAGIGFWRCRRHWFSKIDGLVRLESALHLHNRLSCAVAGIGRWPAFPANNPEQLPSVFHWRWGRLLAPIGCGMAFLIATCAVPLPVEPLIMASVQIQPPLALTEAEAALEPLKHAEVLDSKALSILEEKAESLRKQDPRTWYSQGALEAADALRQEIGQAASGLQQELTSAQKLLPNEARNGSNAQQQEEWKERLDHLENGKLPLNSHLLAQLKQCQTLDTKQLQALQDQLSKGHEASQQSLQTLGSALQSVEQKMQGFLDAGKQARQPGSGGPGGGGTTAPLGLKETPTTAEPNTTAPLVSSATRDLALGDVMKITAGVPETSQPSAADSKAGGAASSSGQGGEAVSRFSSTPKETAVLKEYFK